MARRKANPEALLIGCMLIDNGVIPRVMLAVKARHFRDGALRETYEAAVEEYEASGQLDLMTLVERLKVRSCKRLIALLEQVPSAANYDHWAKLVARRSARSGA